MQQRGVEHLKRRLVRVAELSQELEVVIASNQLAAEGGEGRTERATVVGRHVEQHLHATPRGGGEGPAAPVLRPSPPPPRAAAELVDVRRIACAPELRPHAATASAAAAVVVADALAVEERRKKTGETRAGQSLNHLSGGLPPAFAGMREKEGRRRKRKRMDEKRDGSGTVLIL